MKRVAIYVVVFSIACAAIYFVVATLTPNSPSPTAASGNFADRSESPLADVSAGSSGNKPEDTVPRQAIALGDDKVRTLLDEYVVLAASGEHDAARLILEQIKGNPAAAQRAWDLFSNRTSKPCDDSVSVARGDRNVLAYLTLLFAPEHRKSLVASIGTVRETHEQVNGRWTGMQNEHFSVPASNALTALERSHCGALAFLLIQLCEAGHTDEALVIGELMEALPAPVDSSNSDSLAPALSGLLAALTEWWKANHRTARADPVRRFIVFLANADEVARRVRHQAQMLLSFDIDGLEDCLIALADSDSWMTAGQHVARYLDSVPAGKHDLQALLSAILLQFGSIETSQILNSAMGLSSIVKDLQLAPDLATGFISYFSTTPVSEHRPLVLACLRAMVAAGNSAARRAGRQASDRERLLGRASVDPTELLAKLKADDDAMVATGDKAALLAFRFNALTLLLELGWPVSQRLTCLRQLLVHMNDGSPTLLSGVLVALMTLPVSELVDATAELTDMLNALIPLPPPTGTPKWQQRMQVQDKCQFLEYLWKCLETQGYPTLEMAATARLAEFVKELESEDLSKPMSGPAAAEAIAELRRHNYVK